MQAAPPSPALGAGVCFETVAPAPSERCHVPQSRRIFPVFLYFGTILEVFIYTTGLSFYILHWSGGCGSGRVSSVELEDQRVGLDICLTPDHGTHGADMATHVTSTQSAETCQMSSNYGRILRTLDWAYQSWLMSSCQGRVRVISSKARRMFTFSPLRPITKSHDGDYDCEVDPGTRRPDPGLALCRSPSPRVCVNMCTVCNISSYPRLCSPLPFIHCGQSRAWANKHPALFMPGLKPQPSPHSEHSGPACHLSRGLRRYFETTCPGYFLPVSLCVTPALPLSHKEISVAGQKAELGSGANGYYMDPGRGAARQPGLQTRIANARATSTVFLRSNKICSDNPCHGSWQRQQHYAGRSCLDPGEGDEFLSVTGQQWMS